MPAPEGKPGPATRDQVPTVARPAEGGAETAQPLPAAETSVHVNRPAPGPCPWLNEETLTGPATGSAAASGDLWIPGYTVLGELGRGGMGVVYQARHLALKRLVALKTIRAGASAEELIRFRSEAEAVARLQHPNIVQIYEVGQHAGMPFLSLEFVEGGSLARRLRESPLPIKAVGPLVETLARAVHFAHQRGIVHRDLKPGNILLVSGGGVSGESSADTTDHSPLTKYQPKIADFGLAKQLDTDSGQTRSGAVMGTPSYMAPEQAAGQTRAIGPRTDIYALGAILYELLTGQPPFRGETTLETLEQVRSREPVPPSRLKPNVPHDLETICLKCLAKEPVRRYSSALALAQDLERFNSGESILGRREGLAARLGRKLRRNKVTAGLLLAVLLAVGAAGYVIYQTGDARQMAGLRNAIEASLDTPDWTADRVAEVERNIAALRRLDPAQAELARQRLPQRLARSVDGQLRKPKLAAEDVARVEATLKLLAPLDAKAAAGLRRALSLRLRAWEQVFRLKAPFAGVDAIFDPAQVRVDGDALVRKDAPGTAPTPRPARPATTRSKVPCPGNVQVEAVLDASWRSAVEAGLVLNARSREGPLNTDRAQARQPEPGYAFVVRPAAPGPRSAVGLVNVLVVRNGVPLRDQQVRLPAGPLHLLVRREGDRLTFHVNDLPALVAQDVFPLGGADPGVFGLRLPAGVRLTELAASRQALPGAASPLEKGDDLYDRGRWQKALAYFQEQALAAGANQAAGQEARYKQGLCLVGLKRPDEAAQTFERLAAEPGERWPMLAACRLWFLHLSADRFDRADEIFDTLANRYRFEQLAAVMPSDLRAHILDAYDRTLRGLNLFKPDPHRVRNARRALAVETFLHESPWRIFHRKNELARAFHIVDRRAEALEAARDTMQGVSPDDELYSIQAVEHLSWLLRLHGKAGEAREVVDRWLFEKPGAYRVNYLPLLVERSRVHVALGQWDQAERDIEELFRRCPVKDLGAYHAPACLLRGFLRERRGDSAGARAAWQQGVPRVEDADPGFGFQFLTQTILIGLTDQMSDADIEKLVARVVVAVSKTTSGGGAAGFARLFRLPPGLLRAAWRSPRGRDYARRIAFRSLSFAETVRVPILLFWTELLHQGTMPGPLTAEQDALLWQVSGDLFATYMAGKFATPQVVSLGLTWKGTTNFLGWGGLAPALAPNLRGPLAYVMGQRYLRILNKRNEAEMFFRIALKDAPADSALRRLSQTELDRLKGK